MGEMFIVQVQEKLSEWRQRANRKSRKHSAGMLQVTKCGKSTEDLKYSEVRVSCSSFIILWHPVHVHSVAETWHSRSLCVTSKKRLAVSEKPVLYFCCLLNRRQE